MLLNWHQQNYVMKVCQFMDVLTIICIYQSRFTQNDATTMVSATGLSALLIKVLSEA